MSKFFFFLWTSTIHYCVVADYVKTMCLSFAFDVHCETAGRWNNAIIQDVLNETLSSYINTKGAQKSDNSKLESHSFWSTHISHMRDEGKLI